MNKLLKKALTSGIVIGSLLVTQAVFASSTVELPKGSVQVDEDDKWEVGDEDDAPAIRMIISDGYKRAGETEVFYITLENANLSDGRDTNLEPYDVEGIERKDMTVSAESSIKLEVRIKIPSNLGEDEQIAFSIPMLIDVDDPDVKVTIKPSTKRHEYGLVDEGTYSISSDKAQNFTCQVQDVPTIEDAANMAQLLFKETGAGSINNRQVEMYLELQDDDFSFAVPDYEKKYNNSDTVEYRLKRSNFVEYGGSFEDDDQVFQIIQYPKNPQKMKIIIQGSVIQNSQKGTILLKNIPIKVSEDAEEGKEITLKIDCDTMVGNNQEMVVGYVGSNKEAAASEETEAELENEEQDTDTAAEEESAVEEETVQQQKTVTFKVNEASYTVDGQRYAMEGAAYIQEPGYLMIPVRYVAEAFGVSANEIAFENGTVTFTYNGTTVQLTKNVDIAIVGGLQVQMATALTVKDGRIYAPIGEISKILNLTKSWNGTEQTATFTN